MSNTVIVKLTLNDLRSALQQVGYRVEELTDPVVNLIYLRSATGGLTFDIRPGNWLADAESFVDAAFTAVLQVQGELPLDLVNRWNATRRFARLQLSQQFLVLALDVSVVGGVTADHLRAQIDIWDRLVQELIVYLRDELRELSARKGTTVPVEQAAEYENADVSGPAAALQ
ncbi:YbjN domain-containing protein [Bradyrhizobium sp. 23AC]